MKNLKLIILIIFFSQLAIAQNKISKEIKNNLSKISTDLEAIQFIQYNQNLNYTYDSFDFQKDSSEVAKLCYSKKAGEIISFSNAIYKIIKVTPQNRYRASYIYLDGTILKKTQVDSIRKIILKEYSSGTPFEKLANMYNMDGNPNNGDLGWFEQGKMHIDFENSVKKHKKNDVFILDIKEYHWYYVVKKTFDDEKNFTVSYIKVNQL